MMGLQLNIDAYIASRTGNAQRAAALAQKLQSVREQMFVDACRSRPFFLSVFFPFTGTAGESIQRATQPVNDELLVLGGWSDNGSGVVEILNNTDRENISLDPIPANVVLGRRTPTVGSKYNYFDKPTRLAANSQLLVRHKNSQSPAVTGNFTDVFQCIRPTPPLLLEDSPEYLAALTDIRAGRPQINYNLTIPIPFTGTTNESVKGESKPIDFPLLITGLTTDLTYCTARVADTTGNRGWSDDLLPIYSLAGGVFDYDQWQKFPRPVLLPANSIIRGEFKNGASVADPAGSITLRGIRP